MESPQNSGRTLIKSENPSATPTIDVDDVANQRTLSESDEVSHSDTAVATSNPWSKTRCVFCQKSNLQFNNSKLLGCLHSACIECVNSRLNSVSDAGISCTVCCTTSLSTHDNPFLCESTSLNSETQLEQQSDNARLANIKCTSCHDSLDATSWCVDCNDFLCDGCVQAHQRLKITKDHTIKPKEDADLECNTLGQVDSKSKDVCCPTHPQEKLSLFCETCDTLTCRDCQLNDHKLHSYKFINEIASETRENIASLLHEIKYKRMLLRNATKVISDRQQMITDKKNESLNEITMLVVKLTNAVTSRGKQLVSELNKICDAKQKTLNEKKVALDHLTLLTDQCIEFVNNALSKGSDIAVLKSRTIMMNHLQSIKSKRADIPNPEIPVRIQLGLENANDIYSGISRLGTIYVDGRQYGSQIATTVNFVNQQSIVGAYPGVNQPQQKVANGQPAMYSTRSLNYNNSANLIRVPQNISHNVVGHRNAPHNRTQYTSNAAISYTGLPGYQQQVTSSTHPQNSAVFPNYTTVNFDQGLRRLLMNEKQNQNIASNNASQSVRSVTPKRQPGTIYQNVDLCGNSRVQSVSPQSGTLQIKQYAQQPYPNTSYKMMPQNMMNNHSSRPNMISPGARPIHSRENSLSPSSHQQVQWHIPQTSSLNQNKSASSASSSSPSFSNGDSSFKITLPSSKSRPLNIPPTGVSVSSSVSKTPSPLNHGKSFQDDAEKNLDRVGRDSVNDLMATIARLDGSGIEISPNVLRKQGDSPLVDSSTGPQIEQILDILDNTPMINNKNNNNETQKGCDDPNEDWCAVCMDGGHLVCCDNCPKVFHIGCHIPPLPALPEDDEKWQCMLCSNILDCVEKVFSEKDTQEEKEGLTEDERKIMERMLLELYCQYEPSLPFREVVNPQDVNYYKEIKRPMSLDIVRKKLSVNSDQPYRNLNEIIVDIRLIFRNACSYNEEGSQIYNDAKTLEEFFNQLIAKWLPHFTGAPELPSSSPDDTIEEVFDIDPPAKKSRMSLDLEED